jgi:hypothetical protein
MVQILEPLALIYKDDMRLLDFASININEFLGDDHVFRTNFVSAMRDYASLARAGIALWAYVKDDGPRDARLCVC